MVPPQPAQGANVRPGKQVVPATPLVPPRGVSAGQRHRAPVVPTLAKGTTAPDFLSRDINGKPVDLSNFKGKVMVLDFWATWCGPCQAAFPHTEEVARQFRPQGVVVLAVCTSDVRSKFNSWVKANQSKYPNLTFTCDPHERGSDSFDERASRKLYGVTGIPTQFVIDRTGKIVAVVRGYSPDDHRLEAGLARAGLKVDPADAANGEAQFHTKGS